MNEDNTSNSREVQSDPRNPPDDEPALEDGFETQDEAEAELFRSLKSASPPVRHLIMQMTRLQERGPIPHPIFDKFSSEHVDKFLDYKHQDEVNAYTLE